MNSTPQPDGERITELRSLDVLLGRSRHCFQHNGNKLLRSLIAEKLPEYVAAERRTDKTLIVDYIVRYFLNKGGRFLKSNKDGVTYEHISSHKTIREKVAHSMRDTQAMQKRKEGKLETKWELKKKRMAADKLLKVGAPRALKTSRLKSGESTGIKSSSAYARHAPRLPLHRPSPATVEDERRPVKKRKVDMACPSGASSSHLPLSTLGGTTAPSFAYSNGPSYPPPLFLTETDQDSSIRRVSDYSTDTEDTELSKEDTASILLAIQKQPIDENSPEHVMG